MQLHLRWFFLERGEDTTSRPRPGPMEKVTMGINRDNFDATSHRPKWYILIT